MKKWKEAITASLKLWRGDWDDIEKKVFGTEVDLGTFKETVCSTMENAEVQQWVKDTTKTVQQIAMEHFDGCDDEQHKEMKNKIEEVVGKSILEEFVNWAK